MTLAPLDVIRRLCSDNAKGSQATIEFTVVAISARSNEAVVRQMDADVEQERVAREQMNTAPRLLRPAASALNNVGDTISTQAVAWGGLLQKLKLFTKAMDKISEVWFATRFVALLRRSYFSSRSILMLRWHGRS